MGGGLGCLEVGGGLWGAGGGFGGGWDSQGGRGLCAPTQSSCGCQGCSFGYHAGGWGKPPVDETGKPLYGDVFGTNAAEFQVPGTPPLLPNPSPSISPPMLPQDPPGPPHNPPGTPVSCPKLCRATLMSSEHP